MDVIGVSTQQGKNHLQGGLPPSVDGAGVRHACFQEEGRSHQLPI